MLGNFDFMRGPDRIDDYGGFVDECDKAEKFYAEGEYETSIVWSRKAIELIVKWIYTYPDFGMPAWIGDKAAPFAKHADRLNTPAFVKWLHDPSLRIELDNARLCGNDNVHKHWVADAGTALRCLKACYALVELVEMRLWEEPYIYEFFEPCFDPEPQYTEEDTPLERDYPALIKEAHDNGDELLAAKWALLLKADRPSFDIAPFKASLSEKEPMLQLMNALEDKRVLRSLLQESTIKLSTLIRKCYEESGFDWRETYAVVYMAAKACRAMTAVSAKGIDQCLEKMNTEVSHG